MIGFHRHGESLRLQFVEAGVAAVLNKELVAAGVADAGHRRWRKDYDQRFWNLGADPRVHLRHNRRQSLLGRGSLREFLERQEDGGRVGLVAAEKVEACEFHGVENAGRFVRDLRNLVHDGLRPIERGGVR